MARRGLLALPAFAICANTVRFLFLAMAIPTRPNLHGFALPRYKFGEQLGAGGYASVYSCQHFLASGVNLACAGKVFSADADDRSATDAGFSHFRDELGPILHFGSAHPRGIVRYSTTEIFHVVADPSTGRCTEYNPNEARPNGKPFVCFLIVMDLADGGSLGDLIISEEVIREPGPAVFLEHFLSLCSALQSAHKKGIYHRDLKPSNLLWFREQREVRITDFGIAEYAGRRDNGEALLRGSHQYLAPECFELTNYSPEKRDVYACGCTFFELLTRRPAFDLSATHTALRDAELDNPDVLAAYRTLHHETERPDALDHARDIVSFRLNRLLKRMMHRDPRERCDLIQVIAELQQCRHDLNTTVGEPDLSTIEAYGRPYTSRRHLETRYLINPDLRKEFGEQLCFILLSLRYVDKTRVGKLIYYLESYFGSAYSLFEVYGKFDYLIRVWTSVSSRRLERFMNVVHTQLLDKDTSLMTVIPIVFTRYLHIPEPSQPLPPLLKTAIAIDEVQNDPELTYTDTQAKIQQLVDLGVYLRAVENLDPKKTIKGFTCVQSPTVFRHTLFASTVQHLSKYFKGQTQFRLATYEAGSTWAQPFASAEKYDFVLSYVTNQLCDVAAIPDALGEIIQGQPHTLSTLIATGRYFTFSDGMLVGDLPL